MVRFLSLLSRFASPVLGLLFLVVCCPLLPCFSARAEGEDAYSAYIDKYKDLAVDQMRKHGIPASITLAQGLLESVAGTSCLATKGNNHFGIKVGVGWKGKYMLHDDDSPNEKFRVYRSAAESYEDHSLFLRHGARYAFLFSYDLTDYRSWAHGLKRAGYATNPYYAYQLIEIIERYQLYRYDKLKAKDWNLASESIARDAAGIDFVVGRCNGAYYVIARSGDTYASIAKAMKVKERKLRKYNEVMPSHHPEEGEIVYLEKKSSKAARSLRGTWHTICPGESLHSVAQQYGMRLATLYKINDLPATYRAAPGHRLRIR